MTIKMYDWTEIVCSICGCKTIYKEVITEQDKYICYGCSKNIARKFLEDLTI